MLCLPGGKVAIGRLSKGDLFRERESSKAENKPHESSKEGKEGREVMAKKPCPGGKIKSGGKGKGLGKGKQKGPIGKPSK